MTQSEREKQWQIESDARTVTQYMEIAASESRLKDARTWLEKEREKVDAAITSMQMSKAILAATGRTYEE